MLYRPRTISHIDMPATPARICGATRSDHDEFDRVGENSKNYNDYNTLARIFNAENALHSAMLL
jgi:hypothetical protein